MAKYSSSKIRQAINRYNSDVRRINQQRRAAVNNYNNQVRRHNNAVRQYNQQLRSLANKYNQWVHSYNARVRGHRQRLRSEVARLGQQAPAPRYVALRTSVDSLTSAYERLDRRVETTPGRPQLNYFTDLAERETANSVAVLNTLLGAERDTGVEIVEELEGSDLADALRAISPELDDRWKGALFALNPANPDAVRHFCTSAREVFTQILEIEAPDEQVLSAEPSCDRTQQGNPTRRAKIRFLLSCAGLHETGMDDFVEHDIDNVVELFQVLNSGTHGPVGVLTAGQLRAVKKRVQDGIVFLTRLVVNARSSEEEIAV